MNIERVLIEDILYPENINKEFKIAGLVIVTRKMKTMHFYEIRDCSGIIQVIDKSKLPLLVGNFCEVIGKLQFLNNKYEFHCFNLEIFGLPEEENYIFTTEEAKLKYRIPYIKQCLYKNLKLKSDFLTFSINFFSSRRFCNIQTPILSYDNLSGAEAFKTLGKKGQYFLPQSPQTYKQLLISGGIDRYFQIASCFRDEDQRLDRQFEFLQLDVEVAFQKKEWLMSLLEQFFNEFFKIYFPEKKVFWHKLSFFEAIDNYGTDCPFIYKDMKLQKEDFNRYSFFLPENLNIEKLSKEYKFTLENKKLFFDDIQDAALCLKSVVNLINEDTFSLTWVVDFPLFEFHNGSLTFNHNPFTSPKKTQIESFLNGNNEILSEQFDLSFNGFEILGGSERINSFELQKEVLSRIDLLNVLENMPLFSNSVPPHAGFAIGIERFLKVCISSFSIRDLIAFPKTQTGKCLVFENEN